MDPASERRRDLDHFFQSEVRPRLERLRHDPVAPQKARQRAVWVFGGAMAGFIVLHTLTDALLPDIFAGGLASFLLFPVQFIGSFAIALFLARNWILEFLSAAEERFLARTHLLKRLGETFDVTYVPVPGGAPKGLEWLARRSWAPKRLRQLRDLLTAQGGMDAPVQRARASGLLLPDTIILGSAADRRKYLDQASDLIRIEDGFHGQRAGVGFDLFEWVERIEDKPDVRHLVIVLAAPLRLHGTTQLRSRGLGWSPPPGTAELQEVDLGARAFQEAFRLRSTDQTEARALFNPAVMERLIALSRNARVRAVAHETSLVISLDGEPGANRFNLIDLESGAWSESSVHQAAQDLGDALALTEALIHAFMLRPA